MILPMLLLAIQAAPPPDVPETRRVASVDLPAAWHPAGACPSRQSDTDIVVCGRPDAAERDRLRPLRENYAEVGGPGIGFRLPGKAQGNVYSTQERSPDGKPDKRIMMTVKMAF